MLIKVLSVLKYSKLIVLTPPGIVLSLELVDIEYCWLNSTEVCLVAIFSYFISFVFLFNLFYNTVSRFKTNE